MTLLGAMVCLALPLLAAAGDPAATVEQRGRMFRPGDMAVRPGDTVRFTNNDPFSHQLYVDSEAMHYESGIQDPGSTRDITFPAAGKFEVRCAIHPRMALHVDVR